MERTAEVVDMVVGAVAQASASAGVVISKRAILGKGRSRKLSEARHTAMFILRDHYGYSLGQIGACLGRHHSTVLYGATVIQGSIERHAYCGRMYVNAMAILGIPEAGWLDPFTGKEASPYKRKKNGDLVDPDKPRASEDDVIKPLNWDKDELLAKKANGRYPGAMPDRGLYVRMVADK